MKKIVILGSTGSIGKNALSAVKKLGAGYKAFGLSANSNLEELLAQVRAFRPRYVSVFDYDASQRLKGLLPQGVKLLAPGVEGLSEMASLKDADIVLNAVTGAVGFAPLVAAIRASKHIALANKEPMVMAGPALMREAARWQAKLIPVDSEPSAIFQCLAGVKDGDYNSAVSRIFLTSSGGPFYARKTKFSTVTVKEALNHPRWSMGPKITVDSATLMNKGLEAIEIANLFSVPLGKIQVLIHPQSVMHSGVEFVDGSVLAQLSWPDMRLPIQYALTWPQRRRSPVKPLDFFKLAKLDFARPDFKKFPCLELALWAGKKGGGYPAVLNAANEVAVEKFLRGAVRFTDITVIVEKTLSAHHEHKPGVITLSEAVETDGWARQKAAGIAANIKKR
ncbi:MAG: 1-deoxy-D-xylulose-5-phosphate reductoisomerase [Elusimicrobia bacterium GWF2_52_66]|nr:MAG: 1-deoxy-D-xylulose-5-phosphate reductoisomerase [Elusimicrobia bacterium GWA2_51_34]OGR85783.1 MAG: 1-deoxy-D-xylulose-5-phosphate reductoisomerase [Elusimicrobia bacterium GWF2_52_66]HAF96258.1 1-deoxy-D-xylulose-5-phosphate reductoisomerase [Elusimicrobiota bacterium]HCE97452.1 1-deoxy-D-xylulose-5-phosphate reductoisomerase [Elusimicrobiota bacterium]